MATIRIKGLYVSILVGWMSRFLALGRVAWQDKCIFGDSLVGLIGELGWERMTIILHS